MKNQRALILITSLMVLPMTGCFTISNYFDELRFSRTLHSRAKKVWSRSEGAYQHVEHDLDDFGRGFVAGYRDVARGRNGCPPTVPPPRYWRTKYSNAAGKRQVVAWFDGYHHGAAAAKGDGISNSRQLLTSQEVYNKCRQYVEYLPEDVFQEEFDEEGGDYFWQNIPGAETAPLPSEQMQPLDSGPKMAPGQLKYVPEEANKLPLEPSVPRKEPDVDTVPEITLP